MSTNPPQKRGVLLSHATRVRNRIRSAYLRTEFELNGLRHDHSASRRPAPGRARADGSPRGGLAGLRPSGAVGSSRIRHRAA